MREIKFRAKMVDNSRWVYGGGVWTFPHGTALFGEDEKKNPVVHHVNPETVGEYTGLHDKAGREIFEGDIFEGPYSDRPFSSTKRFQNRRGSVQWNPDQGCIPYPTTGEFKFRFFPTWRECEVVGNIYDNPGLLDV